MKFFILFLTLTVASATLTRANDEKQNIKSAIDLYQKIYSELLANKLYSGAEYTKTCPPNYTFEDQKSKTPLVEMYECAGANDVTIRFRRDYFENKIAYVNFSTAKKEFTLHELSPEILSKIISASWSLQSPNYYTFELSRGNSNKTLYAAEAGYVFVISMEDKKEIRRIEALNTMMNKKMAQDPRSLLSQRMIMASALLSDCNTDQSRLEIMGETLIQDILKEIKAPLTNHEDKFVKTLNDKTFILEALKETIKRTRTMKKRDLSFCKANGDHKLNGTELAKLIKMTYEGRN